MENQNINPESMRFPIGTYVLLWFTNPDKAVDVINGQEVVEQGLCSQFYMSLKEAEDMAKLLSGSWMILMCTAQNPPSENNVYWDAVRFHGESFNLNELTAMPEAMRKKFLEMKDKPVNPNSIG